MTPRLVAAALAAGLLLAACGSEADPVTAGDSSSTTTTAGDEVSSTSTTAGDEVSSTSTTVGSTGSSVTSPSTSDLTVAVFPNPSGTTRFDDPAAAAKAFATDYVGFVGPEVGAVSATTVEIRPDPQGPVTLVQVQQLDGSWWVTGATTANILVASPTPLATITSPVALSGTSTAFEATVQTQVREDGSTTPIGTGYVMGGSMGDMGPFTGSLDFTEPSTPAGAVILSTSSMENGEVWEATVVRVRFD